MTKRLRKVEVAQVPAEEAAAISAAIAMYLNNNKFTIKKITPLKRDTALFEKAVVKASTPDAKHSFFTWRPKH
jgi:hypothetical protein